MAMRSDLPHQGSDVAHLLPTPESPRCSTWVLIPGLHIVTGRSRDSMAALATNMARAALIVTVATSTAMFGRDLQSFLTQDVQDEITYVVTGKDDTAEELIDRNLAYMQLALTSVSVLDEAGDVTLDSAKTRAMWFIGLGMGVPPSLPVPCCCCTKSRWPCSSALARCSSCASCSSRPNHCSSVGCSMASARCSRWPCLQP